MEWFSSLSQFGVSGSFFQLPEAITLALWGVTLLLGAAALRSRIQNGRTAETPRPSLPLSAAEVRGSAHPANI